MKSTIRLLSILLVVQIVAALFSFSSDEELAVFTSETPLSEVTLQEVDAITITVQQGDEEENRELRLAKKEGKWLLPDYYNFPAARDKVDALQSDLLSIKIPYPAGSTEQAAKQFEVGEDNFKTRVTLLQGEKPLEEIYLGSSPAFKKVYARKSNSDTSYALAYNAVELQGKERSWIDRTYLELQPEEVAQIVFSDVTLNRDPASGDIVIEGITEQEQPKKDEIGKLFQEALKVSYLDVLGTEAEEGYNLTTPAFQYTVKTTDEREQTFAFGKPEEETHYVLQVSGEPYFFKVSGFQAEKMKDVTRNSLIEETPEEEEEVAEESASSETVDTE
ncbi:DUF4340 domain-containing protein [bacterium]|nr:DUF4340 domain-containing protein [bacterium]